MNKPKEKHRFISFRAALFIGLCWGFIETILLVWNGRPAFFTWGRYIAAGGIITSLSIFLTGLISIPVSLLPSQDKRTESAWAAALMVPITSILVVIGMLRVVLFLSWKDFTDIYWYLPIFVFVFFILFFFLLRWLIKLMSGLWAGTVFWVISGVLLILIIFTPILQKPAYLKGEITRKELPDVLLITIDTVRADHMASYGYFRQTTPFLDALAQESVLFENAMVQIPWTSTSHISILTSRYPSELSPGWTGSVFAPSYPTLPEELKKNGYQTAAFVSSARLNHRFIKSQKFHLLDDTYSLQSWLIQSNTFLILELFPLFQKLRKSLTGMGIGGIERQAEVTTKNVLEWLKDCPQDRPLFLWIHYYDPHQPLHPPPPYNAKFQTTPELQAFINQRMDLEVWEKKLGLKPENIFHENNFYDNELAYMDHWIEQLFKGIEKHRNRPDNTFVVVTADHGISMGEHFLFGNLIQIYDTVTRVPLIMHSPDGKRGRVSAQVGVIDIMPTILDFLKIKEPSGISGRSLLPLIEGREFEQHPAFCQSLFYPTQYSARTPKWKLIYSPNAIKPFKLFDLDKDPIEVKNLGLKREYLELPEVRKLISQLNQWMQKYHKKTIKGIRYDAKVGSDVEKLRAIGYTQ